MARQLRDRLHAKPVDVHTVHAFGLQLLSAANANRREPPNKRARRTVEVDPNKAHTVWKALVHDSTSIKEWLAVRAAVDRWRQDGVPCCLDESVAPLPRPLVDTIVARMTADRQVVDQEDQVYQCLHYGLRVPPENPYDLCLVDEAQDLAPRGRLYSHRPPGSPNHAQHLFLRRCIVTPDSRTVLCAVGDACQAIYAFRHRVFVCHDKPPAARGADPSSMDNLGAMFGMQRRRLTCCFRCPRRVVFTASQINRGIRAAPDQTKLGHVQVLTTDPRRLYAPGVVEQWPRR